MAGIWERAQKSLCTSSHPSVALQMCLCLSHGEHSSFHVSPGIMAAVCVPLLMGTEGACFFIKLCLILGPGRGFSVVVVGANCVCTLSFHSHISYSILCPSGTTPLSVSVRIVSVG